MSGLNLTEMSGVTLVKMGLLSVDTEIPRAESWSILRDVAREADRRGWPDGWYEDPSILSAEQLGLPDSRPRLDYILMRYGITDGDKLAAAVREIGDWMEFSALETVGAHEKSTTSRRAAGERPTGRCSPGVDPTVSSAEPDAGEPRPEGVERWHCPRCPRTVDEPTPERLEWAGAECEWRPCPATRDALLCDGVELYRAASTLARAFGVDRQGAKSDADSAHEHRWVAADSSVICADLNDEPEEPEE